MADNTGIEWCDSTFNPWVGCTKISPACDHCYAESWAKRSGMVKWGNEPRRRTSISNWRQPLKWQATAAEFEQQHGHRRRVFCASLADVFDNQVPDQWRHDLWSLIERCWGMDWLLLTKRPQNIEKMLPDAPTWENIRRHVWLGTTVEDQRRLATNVPHLLRHDCAVRFVSIEPMLGAIEMQNYLDARCNEHGHRVDWVIAGGESGLHARPSHPNWFRSLRDQCAAAGVPFLFKQWGNWVSLGNAGGSLQPDEAKRCWLHANGTIRPSEDADAIDKEERRTGPQPWALMLDVGKKRTGRLLDGIEHNGFPVSDLSRVIA